MSDRTLFDSLPGDCPGCGTEYPYCDCSRDEDSEAEAREGWYTAMEIIDAR